VIVEEKINDIMITFIIEEMNKGHEIILLTKHDGNMEMNPVWKRIKCLFDKIIHYGG
jgi:hypothetical protein